LTRAADVRRAQGHRDPEQKRKIIGKLFVDVFQRESAKIKNAKWLAQGTIYPDVIESAGAKTKKGGHNQVAPQRRRPAGKLHSEAAEPLRELFKDEVRELGLELGLPRAMVVRHPFPGPGLGVRVLGEVKQTTCSCCSAPMRFSSRNSAARAGTTKPPRRSRVPAGKSVGVMGDGRTYEYVVALRAVETSDFMTAGWAPLPHELLAKVSSRIINEVRGINRVTYDISSKPPATIEWE
jgi:GMP synthase (glutamine-hydrolysing)